VSLTITRTGRVSNEATRASPAGETPAHPFVCRRTGSVRLTMFPVKQFPRPESLSPARKPPTLGTPI
jgi:hypothetical protein